MKWVFSVVPPLCKINVFVNSVRWQDGTHDLVSHLYHSWITWMVSKITLWSIIKQCWCIDGSSSRFIIKWISISVGSQFIYWLRLCYKVSGRRAWLVFSRSREDKGRCFPCELGHMETSIWNSSLWLWKVDGTEDSWTLSLSCLASQGQQVKQTAVYGQQVSKQKVSICRIGKGKYNFS